MDLVQAIFLGALQGITEWLPISSQGQVALTALQMFNIPGGEALRFAFILHIGTLIAATIYFRKDLAGLGKKENRPLLRFLAIAVLATAVTGFPAYFFIKAISGSTFLLTIAIGFFLVLTGIIQLGKKGKQKAEMNNSNALILGLAQGFSVLPGISRSGITSAALLVKGFNPEKAFRLSFILSVPSVFLGEIALGVFEGTAFQFEMIAAIIAAAITGLVSIHILLSVVKRVNFAGLCIAFGLLYFLIAFL